MHTPTRKFTCVLQKTFFDDLFERKVNAASSDFTFAIKRDYLEYLYKSGVFVSKPTIKNNLREIIFHGMFWNKVNMFESNLPTDVEIEYIDYIYSYISPIYGLD